jgi:polyisoprenoid-binding protein YceI
MRKVASCAALAIACAVVHPASAQTAAHSIDSSTSKATFCVSHIWVERVCGTVPIESGTVTLAPGSLVPSSVTAALDATKIATGEPDRDASLRSPDFFDTQRFPRWTFTSTKIVPRADNAFEVDGELTIHGVTRPEKLDVSVSGDAPHQRYHATGEIDRHAFGMSVTRLDPTIGGTVDVTLDVEFKG